MNSHLGLPKYSHDRDPNNLLKRQMPFEDNPLNFPNHKSQSHFKNTHSAKDFHGVNAHNPNTQRTHFGNLSGPSRSSNNLP